MSAKGKVERQDCHAFLEEWLRKQQKELSAIAYTPMEVRWGHAEGFLLAFERALESFSLFPKTDWPCFTVSKEKESAWQGPIRDWYLVGQDVQKALLKFTAEESRVRPSEQPDQPKTVLACR